MGTNEEAFVKTFTIAIQLGAIMAIVLLYARKFLGSIIIYKKLFVAFVPTAIIGFLAYGIIKTYLFNPLIVAVALILGGIVLILVDKKVASQNTKYLDLEKISYKHAFFIGFVQCVSMVPGVSRAAATIIGGVFNGLDKKQAAEFSFLLAIPTMFAATGYDLYKSPLQFNMNEIMLLITGLAVAFVFAWLAVKLFIKFVEKYGFKYFGWYCIVIGIVFLVFVIL